MNEQGDAMKNLLRLVIVILMMRTAYAQSNLPACPSSSDSLFFKNSGYFHNCFGTKTYADGDKYVGEYKDDKRNGQGIYTFANGEKYVGEFKDNEFYGQGTFYYLGGTTYVGEWRGKRNGQGTHTTPSGEKYVGEFKDNNFHGYGTTYTSNGSIASQGIWAENKFVSSALVQQATVPVCQGSDASRWSYCFGTYNYADGSKYIGEWKDGKKNGQGTLTITGGDKYVGEFKDDKLHGQGTYTFAKGGNYVGEFKDDKRKQGTLTLPSGDKYVGEFKDNKLHGQGTFSYADGTKYIGEWKDGKKNGQGTFYNANGSITDQGIYADNKLVRSVPVQQATVPNQEVERLKAEADDAKRKQVELANTQRIENERLRAEVSEAKRKQAEAEEKIRVAQQQTTLTPPVTIQAAIPIGKRVALVVGNKNYKVRPLQNTLNDADDISRSLRTSGFEVIDLRDATLPQMRTAVRQFGDKLLTYDVGLVYYSGHGVEVKGRNYFIPVNADIQREDEIADQGLDVSLILEKMNTAGKGVNILIVDACRDDPFGRSFRSTSRGLAQMDAPRGTIIAYSTSPGKVASDGDTRERNSPYTKHLLRAMQAPNKPIEQVFKEVRRAVQDETKNQQTPWENTSLSGDFFFKVQR
jgi:hypothetical protein